MTLLKTFAGEASLFMDSPLFRGATLHTYANLQYAILLATISEIVQCNLTACSFAQCVASEFVLPNFSLCSVLPINTPC